MCSANRQTLYKHEAHSFKDEEYGTCSGRAAAGAWCPDSIPSMFSGLQFVPLGPGHSYLHYVLKMPSAKDQTNSRRHFPLWASV